MHQNLEAAFARFAQGARRVRGGGGEKCAVSGGAGYILLSVDASRENRCTLRTSECYENNRT